MLIPYVRYMAMLGRSAFGVRNYAEKKQFNYVMLISLTFLLDRLP